MSYISPIEQHLRDQPYLLYSGGYGTTLGRDTTLSQPLWSAALNFGERNYDKLVGFHREFSQWAHVLLTNTFRMQLKIRPGSRLTSEGYPHGALAASSEESCGSRCLFAE